MSEIWKPIPEYEGYYEVSNCGAVRSLPRKVYRNRYRGQNLTIRGRILTRAPQAGGYLKVILSKHGTAVHRRTGYLVLLAFVGPRPSRHHEVSHLNNVRTDDRLENVIWETKKKNNERKREHGTNGAGSKNAMAQLTEDDIKYIRATYRYRVNSAELGKRFGVDPKHIWRIANGHRWTHVE